MTPSGNLISFFPPERSEGGKKEIRYQILGDILLLKREEDAPRARDLLRMHPRCTKAILYRGTEGPLRRPRIEVLHGGSAETRVREHGCLYHVDLSRVMFSPGNLAEKLRMAQQVQPREHVADLCAGIGHFTIPIALYAAPGKITAIEINPDAYGLLLENLRLNHLDNVEAILGDAGQWAPRGTADRAIVGHLDAPHLLPPAIASLRPGGLLHYHEGVPEAVLQRPIQRLRPWGAGVRVEAFRKVKKYAPGVWHTTTDIRRA